MSDVSWDDDDFEPKKATPALPSDKWDGEDEDDVKDNWDDEEDRALAANSTATTTTTTTQVKKKKKKLGDIIAEKEAKQQEEVERRRRELEERATKSTLEGQLAEKLRLQKVQEDADLQLASELVGDSTSSTQDDDCRLLEGVDLSTAEGLSSLRRSLVAKIRETDRLEKRPAYIAFLEDLVRDLCQNVEVDEVKKVTGVLNTLYNEKMRANKPKSKKKQLGKAKLNVGSGPLVDDFAAEYDDFI
ncbi:eukaryotic translation initiation factor 3 subunit J-like [Portunus trituberculatus]|uniref:eukaryotic translation initiation factor 3 subunit J-like n=1 Tax=Portunus trituberculatus TaxID=210409 RepID=UPI001E1CBB3C|nr:eukaryotic translation initiation factor 3 subunit J-like [Portunus trituberculatus]